MVGGGWWCAGKLRSCVTVWGGGRGLGGGGKNGVDESGPCVYLNGRVGGETMEGVYACVGVWVVGVSVCVCLCVCVCVCVCVGGGSMWVRVIKSSGGAVHTNTQTQFI